MESTLSSSEQARRKRDLALTLDRDRAALVLDHPFVGFLAMHLDIVPVFDPRVRTAATDGHRIFANPDFFDTLSPREREFVLAHEVWHCALRHIERRGDRDPWLWNVAIDLEANRLLADEGLVPPDGVLLDDQYTAAEERYAELERDRAREQEDDGDGREGDAYGGWRLRPSASRPDRRGRLADTHLDGSTDQGDGDSDGMRDSDLQPSAAPVPEEVWARRLRVAAQHAELRGGTVPGHLGWQLDELRRPTVNWREVLRKFVTRRFGGERRWLPPARRGIHRGLYLPSRTGELLRLTVAVDTSDSCVDFAPTLFGELDGVVRAFGRYEIELILCDAKIHSVERYGPERPLSAATVEPVGRGGTSFVPVFEHHAERTPPDALLYLTDGEGLVPETAPTYPVLWAILDRWAEVRRRSPRDEYPDPVANFRRTCGWGQIVPIPFTS